jgi:hypothetical protein
MGNHTPAVPESCVPGMDSLHTGTASCNDAIQPELSVCANAVFNSSTTQQKTMNLFILLITQAGMQI